MSVTTEADKKLESAKFGLEQAHQSLLEFLDTSCWGNEEYSDEFKTTVEKSLTKIRKIKNKL